MTDKAQPAGMAFGEPLKFDNVHGMLEPLMSKALRKGFSCKAYCMAERPFEKPDPADELAAGMDLARKAMFPEGYEPPDRHVMALTVAASGNESDCLRKLLEALESLAEAGEMHGALCPIMRRPLALSTPSGPTHMAMCMPMVEPHVFDRHKGRWSLTPDLDGQLSPVE